MAKDPAFLFYSSDFLSGTFTMSNEQIGIYIKLLCFQHQKGIITEKDMLKICNGYDEDIIAKFQKNELGYYNARLKEEADKRSAYSESRRKNKMKKDITEHTDNISTTYVTHMENENEDEDIIENTIVLKKEADFPQMPKPEDVMEIPDIKIGSAIELLGITKKITATYEEVRKLWEVFKIQNLDGKTYYANVDKVYSHFINWIKIQKFENNGKSINETRFDKRIEYASRYNTDSEKG